MKKIMMMTLCAGFLASASAATLTESGLELGSTEYTTTLGVCDNGKGANAFNGGTYSQFSFTLSDSLFDSTTNTAATSNAITVASDGSQSYSFSMVALDSIQIWHKTQSGTLPAGLARLQIKDSTGAVVATSTLQETSRTTLTEVFGTASGWSSDHWDDWRNVVWTFDNESALLTVGETYTAYLQDATGASVSMQILASHNGAQTEPDSTIAASIQSGFQPAGMEISVYSTTQSIPEPTTATLSLLALAGLAARRRRK